MRQRVFKLLAAIFLIAAGVGITAAVADATGLISVSDNNGGDAVGWD